MLQNLEATCFVHMGLCTFCSGVASLKTRYNAELAEGCEKDYASGVRQRPSKRKPQELFARTIPTPELGDTLLSFSRVTSPSQQAFERILWVIGVLAR